MNAEPFLTFNPRPYQQQAIDLLVRNPRFCLFLGMGLGKTVIVLTALARLIDIGAVRRVLVVAPKAVSRTVWDGEASRWEHLRHLISSKVGGPAPSREKGLQTLAEIYLVSSTNLSWAQEYCAANGMHFDAVVFDELSQYRNWTSERTVAARKISANSLVVWGLTGTPSPNGLQDLFSEISLIDKGARFGSRVTAFRAKYCAPRYYQNGVARGWYVKKETAPALLSLIRDITFSVNNIDAMRDTLPPAVSYTVNVTLPPEIEKRYRDFKESQLLECTNGETIAAVNAAVLIAKLQQFASGQIYKNGQPDNRDENVEWVHQEKLIACQGLILRLRDEGYKRGIIVVYQFAHERDRLRSCLDRYGAQLFKGTPEQIAAWNAGNIPVLLVHPASAAHGLNLQCGGSVVIWYGLTYNRELHDQLNKRVHRTGQTETVRYYYLSVLGTIEPAIMTALARKSDLQTAVLADLQAHAARRAGKAIAAASGQ